MIQNKGECINMDNNQKNQYVKREITKALLELLEKKELNEISISEITSKAQVGRVSFYRNFKRKEDILEQYLLFIINDWEIQANTSQLQINELLKSLFEHLITYKNFYTLLYKKGVFHLFRDTLKHLITKETELPNIAAYSISFVSYGIYGLIKEWLARGMQESSDEIYTLLNNIEAIKQNKAH